MAYNMEFESRTQMACMNFKNLFEWFQPVLSLEDSTVTHVCVCVVQVCMCLCVLDGGCYEFCNVCNVMFTLGISLIPAICLRLCMFLLKVCQLERKK